MNGKKAITLIHNRDRVMAFLAGIIINDHEASRYFLWIDIGMRDRGIKGNAISFF